MNRSTGWEVMRSPRGSVLQSGAQTRSAVHHHDLMSVNGWMTRAVVLNTYYSDEEDRDAQLLKNLQKGLLCDVRTYGRYSRNLFKVPVLQSRHGLHDQDFYVPRPATKDVEGGDFIPQPTDSKAPTKAESLDGDHVLVGFLENDPSQPVIMPYTLPHPQTKFEPVKEDGRVRRIRHNGIKVEWDKDSNFSIDATEAAKDELLADGAEDPAAGMNGKITLVTTDGTNKTSILFNEQAKIHIAADPTAVDENEPAVCGGLWITVMGELIDQLVALCGHLELQTHGSAVGPTTVPINAADFTTVKGELNSIKGTIDAKDHVSDFIFVRKAH